MVTVIVICYDNKDSNINAEDGEDRSKINVVVAEKSGKKMRKRRKRKRKKKK